MFEELKLFFDNMTYLEMSASTLVIVGVWYISVPKFRGQVIMLAAQILWILHSITVKSPGLFLQSIVLCLLNLKALHSWHTKKVGLERKDADFHSNQ